MTQKMIKSESSQKCSWGGMIRPACPDEQNTNRHQMEMVLVLCLAGNTQTDENSSQLVRGRVQDEKLSMSTISRKPTSLLTGLAFV